MSAVHATCGRVGSDSTKPDMQALAAQARGTDIVTELRWHVLSSYGPQDGHDEWSESVGLRAYRLDVTRDQGAIARAAVGAA